MMIYLLTHQREHHRETNTGQVVSEVLGEDCQVITWYRKEPDQILLDQMESNNIALLYPSDDAQIINDMNIVSTAWDGFILLDGTWQEAQKMYNQSPYLKTCPKVAIQRKQASIYQLRRNQKDFGLCTAECVVELLSLQQVQQAARLKERLITFVAIHSRKGLIRD